MAATTQKQLLGDANRPGLLALPRLVTDAEVALQAGHLQLAQSCLQTYFAETSRQPGSTQPAAQADQHAVRAHFAAGQLVALLSSRLKGQQLVNAVLEAVEHIMRGVELASANPARYSHLVYNGSVHYSHAARPLQCDKLWHHLLPSQERLCQALERVEGQPAWRVRHLLSLALCQQSSGEGSSRPEDVTKTLSKALELATAANLQPLRAEVLALQTHQQTLQAAKAAAAGKPGGAAAGGGGKVAAAGATPPVGVPAAPAAAKQGQPAGKKKAGDASGVGAGKADVNGALATLQWVLSARPDVAVAEQQLQAALKLLDVQTGKPDKHGHGALLKVVGRIGWAAAVCGATQLAQTCTRRAAASQELGSRVWADLTRLLLSLKAAPDAALGPASDSSGAGAALSAAAVRARREVLEGVDEAVSACVKLGDIEGIHNCAVLAWNAGLPLLQPCHRSLIKPAFTAVAKALEAVGSPWSQLRAALHLEVAKAEADADAFIKAAREVSTALSLNYPSSSDMLAACGYERSLDRYLEPMARAAQLRGVAPLQASSSSSSLVPQADDDDVVLLLERARDSKSAPLRSEYLQKAVNKLALLPAVPPPADPTTTDALQHQQQLRAARARTQLWADISELAWRPCQLDALVLAAVPFVLACDWQSCADKEMLLLQARAALLGADAAKAALLRTGGDVGLPPGYTPCLHQPLNGSGSSSSNRDGGSRANANDSQAGGAAPAGDGKGQRAAAAAGSAGSSGSHRKAGKAQALGFGLVEDLQRMLADGMRLSVAAGGSAWLVTNAAAAAWNAYLHLLQRERYADLSGLLLPLLQQLLQEPSVLEPSLVMLAEATAKAAEHVALLTALQQQQQQQQQQLAAPGSSLDGTWPAAQQAAALPALQLPLAEARGAAAGLDVAALLAGSADAAQLAADTAAAVQAVLTRASAASEPQGLIQAFARLQQLQNKPVTLPPGAPAAMAATSKLLALIEGLTVSAPSSLNGGVAGGGGAPQAAAAAVAPAVAAAGRLSSALSTSAAAAAAKVSVAGGKAGSGAAAAPAMGKAEQDVRAAMSLLSAMPAVNLQLWAQLARAAGCHGLWLLARECASAALGALPEGKRDLSAVAAASDVPQVGPQGWYWLAVAEMQQGQAVVSLLPPASRSGAAASLSLCRRALQHFATAARLASFVRRADLGEAAARLAYNVAILPGGLMETGLTRAAAVQALTQVAAGLNATRPADISFQVTLNLLLLECLAAAGRWADARRHIEALHRSLPLSKHKGSGAAAALEALAGWRATCIAKAPSGRVAEDMTRLLADLSTPQAKARAWLAFAQASTSAADQLSARQSALAALDGLPPRAQVDHQLEFAQWLAAGGAGQLDTQAASPSPEQLLLDAADALDGSLAAAPGRPGSSTACRGSSGSGSSRRPGSCAVLPAAAQAAGSPDAAGPCVASLRRGSRCTAEFGGEVAPAVAASQTLEQLMRVHLMLSQVAAATSNRRKHLLASQDCAHQLLTQSLLAAGAEAPLAPAQLLQEACATGPDVPDAPADAVGPGARDNDAQAQQQLQLPQQAVPDARPVVVPALALPSRPPTAATSAASAGSTFRCQRGSASAHGLCKSMQLPVAAAEWAVWLPGDALLQALLSQAAGAAAVTATTLPGQTAAGACDAYLSKRGMQAPALLLANLQLLSQQLQASGRHAAALPVLQLARLVALIVLGSEVAAAAVALQLSALCEQLGASAAAAEWLQLAAPERWPSPEQLQRAETSMAVQQLARDLLVQTDSPKAAAAHAGSTGSLAAEQTAFLVEALQGVQPETLQAWRQAWCDPSSSTSVNTCSASSSSSLHRPRSAAGGGAAAASLAASTTSSICQAGAGGLLQLKPSSDCDSWVSIARYRVEHAQYTAGQDMCSLALQAARSAGDSHHQAEVLLLQARLALLAQQYGQAVELSQAAQSSGGSVQLWRDSVLCYAAARAAMPGRGAADATDALEAGAALQDAVARGCRPCFTPALLEASGRLRLQLSQQLAAQAQQQLQEAEGGADASCFAAAAQLHTRALAAARKAAQDAEQAGAVLLQAEALQQAAGLLLTQPEGVGCTDRQQQEEGKRGSQHAQPAGVMQRHEAVQTALGLLQTAYDALIAVALDCAPGDVQLAGLVVGGASTTQHDQPEQQQQQLLPALHTNTPSARSLVSLLVQLSGAEAAMAQLQLQHGGHRQAADPQFPRVQGRDPRAVIAFLTAGETEKDGESTASHLALALQHAEAAAQAAAAAMGPQAAALHAAALLAMGRACKLQAHAAMLEEAQHKHAHDQQQQPPTDDGVASPGGRNGGNSSAAALGGAFAAAWLPWPGPLLYRGGSAAVTAAMSASTRADPAGAVSADSGSAEAATADSSDCAQATASQPAATAEFASAATPQQLPPAAAEGPYLQALQCLEQALHKALQLQELHTAGAAARELVHGYGQLQPDRAALNLAVAQSCSTALAVREWFGQAAALQHPEVLLWRQQQQLAAVGCGADSVHQRQVQQLLATLGTTHRRLQVPQPDTLLMPLVAQLSQPHQRLLLLYFDAQLQQLVLAAWGMPGSKQAGGAAAAAAAAASEASAPGSTAAGQPRSASGGGASTARTKRASTARDSSRSHTPASADAAVPPTGAVAEGAAAGGLRVPPPPAALASMPCTQQQLRELTAACSAYSRQLQKAVVSVTSQPVPAAPAAAAPAAAPAEATQPAAAAAAARRPPAGAVSVKAGAGKDKAAKDVGAAEVPPWVPPTPAFPSSLNEQWQQLLQQFEGLLQPLANMLQDALQPATRAADPASSSPAAKQGSTQKGLNATNSSSASGAKADTAAAAAAAAAQPVPVTLQLLLDPQLCDLPWEALPVLKRSCSSIARCLSLAQLQQCLQPPPAGQGQEQQPIDTAATLDVSRLSYLVDPNHHMSAPVERPGCYAAPLLPTFRQQLLDALGGPEWQGYAGGDCHVPSAEQLLRPLLGAKGLLVLGPGRLLGHVGTQAVAGLDLSGCTAALLLDRLDNAASASHQTRADNRKSAAQRALEGPCQTAALLMLRGVRAVAAAALPGTPHSHLSLAAYILRGMVSSAAGASSQQTPQHLVTSSGLTLGEAVLAAQRQGLAGFELHALREAGLVVYGMAAVCASGDGGGSAGKGQRKG